MTTGTALVHPSTAKLTPEEQAKGNYVYTPPEVLAYNNGESLDDDDMRVVLAHYGGQLPAAKPEVFTRDTPPRFDERRVTSQPAIAAPYGKPTKLVAKKKAQSGATPLDAAYVLVAALDDNAAYSLLCHLAGRFDLDME